MEQDPMFIFLKKNLGFKLRSSGFYVAKIFWTLARSVGILVKACDMATITQGSYLPYRARTRYRFCIPQHQDFLFPLASMGITRELAKRHI